MVSREKYELRKEPSTARRLYALHRNSVLCSSSTGRIWSTCSICLCSHLCLNLYFVAVCASLAAFPPLLSLYHLCMAFLNPYPDSAWPVPPRSLVYSMSPNRVGGM